MASGSTGNYSIPYPIPTDPVNITGDVEALATRIDNILQEEIEDTSAAMWTGGTFTNGLQTPIYNDSTGKMSMSLAQDIQTSASPTFVDLTLTGNADITGSIVNAEWDGDTIAVNKGGTGITSYATGDIVYASASTTIAKLGIGANNYVLTSDGSVPQWTQNTGTGNVVRASSPTLSGTPLAPTASVDTNTTQIATTAFVIGQGYLKSSTASATYAPINSPTFTGTVTVPGITSTGNLMPSSDNTGVVGDETYTWSNGQFTNITIDSTINVREAIDLADSDILRFGTSDDVQIFYNGSTNVINVELESAATSLNITDNGTDSIILYKTGDLESRGDDITFLSGQASGSSNFSITVDRGSDPDVQIRWNETGDVWQITNDGVNFVDIGSGGGGEIGFEALFFLAGM